VKPTNKLVKPLIALGVLVLIILAMFFIYQQYKPETTKGAKKIIVEVVIPDQKNKEITLHTDGEFLGKPLEEEKLIKGTKGDFGLFIQEVDGHKANDTKKEWWCVTKDGAEVNTGIDSTPIKDGDHFELTLKTGY